MVESEIFSTPIYKLVTHKIFYTPFKPPPLKYQLFIFFIVVCSKFSKPPG